MRHVVLRGHRLHSAHGLHAFLGALHARDHRSYPQRCLRCAEGPVGAALAGRTRLRAAAARRRASEAADRVTGSGAPLAGATLAPREWRGGGKWHGGEQRPPPHLRPGGRRLAVPLRPRLQVPASLHADDGLVSDVGGAHQIARPLFRARQGTQGDDHARRTQAGIEGDCPVAGERIVHGVRGLEGPRQRPRRGGALLRAPRRDALLAGRHARRAGRGDLPPV
mmetsp:Transcript_62804/g.174066  ORF Transcript_62804/g.174066 Transcript_62804/m.174066 type:complete len:223 (-) Transcript_62804:466-1134(-)